MPTGDPPGAADLACRNLAALNQGANRALRFPYLRPGCRVPFRSRVGFAAASSGDDNPRSSGAFGTEKLIAVGPWHLAPERNACWHSRFAWAGGGIDMACLAMAKRGLSFAARSARRLMVFPVHRESAAAARW